MREEVCGLSMVCGYCRSRQLRHDPGQNASRRFRYRPDPGGALNADQLRVEKQAQEFVGRIDQAGKPLAVICHGPWLLVSANCVKGRSPATTTLTGFHTIQDDIRRKLGG